MSFVGKFLASIGIGAATVDTKIFGNQFTPGDNVEGIVQIRGGNVEQKINSIYMWLLTKYKKEVDEQTIMTTGTVGHYQITEPLIIKTNEIKEIPFSFKLPLNTPLTLGKTKVYVETGLDIKKAFDPQDLDYISVVPHPLVAAIFDALKELGFCLRNADCEEAKGFIRKQNCLPFIQEFEFIPISGVFKGKLDELEIVYFLREDEVEVLMEIDRRERGLLGWLSESMDLDESLIRFLVTKRDVPQLTDILYALISKHI